MAKKISILIPCFNEEENIKAITRAITEIMEKKVFNYDYEIIFIDNCSTDKTRNLLREICECDPKVKCIFNAKNFGQFNSPYYGLCQTSGDCTILISCDFQDPVELIPELIQKWEEGNKIVCSIKTNSEEGFLFKSLRNMYYKLIQKFSTINQIEHFTGFGLYDSSFISVLRNLNDPLPFLRGIVAELGFKVAYVYYKQNKRAGGKTHNNWFTLYDAAMLSFTSYTTVGLRCATLIGVVLSAVSLSIAVIYLILKLIFWDRFIAGILPILILICIFSSIQLLFIGILGEYILTINKRLLNRPLVIEEERINF